MVLRATLVAVFLVVCFGAAAGAQVIAPPTTPPPQTTDPPPTTEVPPPTTQPPETTARPATSAPPRTTARPTTTVPVTTTTPEQLPTLPAPTTEPPAPGATTVETTDLSAVDLDASVNPIFPALSIGGVVTAVLIVGLQWFLTRKPGRATL